MVTAFPFWGLKKRGRKEDSHLKRVSNLLRERQRLTASAAFLDNRIQDAFEQKIKRLEINCK